VPAVFFVLTDYLISCVPVPASPDKNFRKICIAMQIYREGHADFSEKRAIVSPLPSGGMRIARRFFVLTDYLISCVCPDCFCKKDEN
jgi:hypothetical protein